MAKLCYKIADISQIKYIPEDNEVFMDRESKQLFLFQDGRWMLLKTEDLTPKMKLYDINKQLASNLCTLSDEQTVAKAQMITEWSREYMDEYFMLYGKEISYFTVLHFGDSISKERHHIGNVVIECLESIGNIKSIDVATTGDGIEIWLVPYESNENTCLYLFPYDAGVVEV